MATVEKFTWLEHPTSDILMEHEGLAKTTQIEKPTAATTLQSAAPEIQSPHDLLWLHRAIGNQAVGRMLQPKLTISEPGDIYEQEADRVAEHVMRMPAPALPSPVSSREMIQRKCQSCSEEDKKKEEEESHEKLSRKESKGVTASGGTVAPPVVHEVLRSPGRPLDPATRAFFEPRFGADLGHVRVHDDSDAHASARQVGALAFAVGRDIVFAQGTHNLSSYAGRSLMAHELTHVLQATGSESATVRRAPAGPQSIQGELGELLATQFLDEQGLYVFVDWSKSVNENGFDFIAYNPKTGTTWYIDNKAYSGTIDEVTSFGASRFATNEATAKSFLAQVGTTEANAALQAIDKGAVEKVVMNAFSKGNAGFSEKVFAAGIKAFDVRLGKLFSSRATWLTELRGAGLLTGIRKFTRRDRVLGRQRGFATIGGLIWTLVVIGTTVYAISQAEDKPKAIFDTAADFVVAGLVYRLAGGIGLLALSLLSLCSDDPDMQKECERRDVVMGFLRTRLPNTIKTTTYLGIFYSEEVDPPEIYQEAYDFLFNTQPIVLAPTPKPTFTPAPAPGVFAPNPGPPPQ